MRRALCLIALLLAAPVAAQDWQTLGQRRIFTNDQIGDGHDRWHTGALASSTITGFGWEGALPTRPLRLLEWRMRSEIITPGPSGVDRPYAGAASQAVIAHFGRGPLDLALGIEGTRIGPSTRLSEFQKAFHDTFSLPAPQGAQNQLPDQSHLGALGEVAWPLALGPDIRLRPYLAARTGVETYARAGADVLIGTGLASAMLIRDEVTGHLLPGITGQGEGLSYAFGADWTALQDSAYLPAARVTALGSRWRARAGLHWQSQAGGRSQFLGLTWLSSEFEGQGAGQLLGSVSLDLRF